MASTRTPIPSALQRQLFIEAGYQCSIPSCGATAGLEIDHIEDWSQVRAHEYENLIVLCANHHAMKSGTGPRALNSAALKLVKSNQVELNGRYGDVERRVIDHFVKHPESSRVHLPGDFDLLLSRLLDAGFVRWDPNGDGNIAVALSESSEMDQNSHEFDPQIGPHLIVRRAYRLTELGAEYVSALREARAFPDR